MALFYTFFSQYQGQNETKRLSYSARSYDMVAGKKYIFTIYLVVWESRNKIYFIAAMKRFVTLY